MAKGYWIANNNIFDMDGLLRYRDANREVMTKYGAVFLVMHGQQRIQEGSSRAKQIVVEFPSYRDAVDYHDSIEYQNAAKMRRAISEGALVIVEGYDGPQGMHL
ncbi:uncharacterized protein (DUF1330 family) [Flavobacterium araucananum]|uniref:DUF1330 domain-containing protein n=1 Tax=Flavobacterium araucananum TaxID=946678 RepID=A0A227P593_9FLAO|nr:DUF1330 domain-containing protein [Flavobacterium araucananum]OXG05091.1 hypothetical protein B0A64_13765 [Flavobacterium araucananum]PWJ96808.1 uncharacterized protein (DUF1330 family) [Flavobacterium araucananum]